MLRLSVLIASLFLAAAPADAAPCGGAVRCEVEGGYYLAVPPADWDGVSPLPLLVFFHGWNSSPEAILRNGAMLRAVHRRGALFVVPYARNGYWRQIGDGRAEHGRDELAYVRDVMADIARHWPVDPTRSLASGFSRGASMVWNVACYGGDLFRAYAPIAGGFWGSTPATCPTGSVNMRHIHGLSDREVAFDRIGIYNSMPISEGLAVLQSQSACGETVPAPAGDSRLTCQRWAGCASGRVLELCLHDGGHSIPAEWVADGLDWMMDLPE